MPPLIYYALALLAFAIGAILVKRLIKQKSSKIVTTVPGLEPSNPENGNLSDVQRAGSLHEFLMKLHAKFGPITGFWWGKTYVVSIASPHLFKQHSNISDQPPVLFALFEPLFGSASLQYANGPAGRYRRQHYDNAFAHERLVTFYEKIQKEANAVEKKWLEKGEQDHIPLSQDMFGYAIKSSAVVLMGESFSDDTLVQGFRTAYETAWTELERRYVDPILPPDNSPRMTQFREAVQHLQSTIKEVIEHRKEHNLIQHGHLMIDDILDYAPGEDAVISDALTYMIGSFHTSANLLTWCIYYLARHSDVQERLYREYVRVLGNKEVTEDNIMRLRYTTQVIDETLRCAVVAPWGARFQEVDSELGEHKIPKDTPVIHAFGVVHQDDTFWPQPKKFDPDRFSPENAKGRNSFAFVPFGFAGRRRCPGHKFAYLEVTVLLATLIRRFKVSVWDDQVAKPVYGFVTHPQEEVWLKISRRS